MKRLLIILLGLLTISTVKVQGANKEKPREEVMKSFCGKYSVVAPGVQQNGTTWVYNMELDPVNATCQWVEEGIVQITHSKIGSVKK